MQTENVPCAKRSEKITLISCNFNISFNIVKPDVLEKATIHHNFTSLLLKWLYSNIFFVLLLVEYDCKLFVDTHFLVVSSCCSAPPEQFHTKTHSQGQPNASQMLSLWK